MHICCKKITAKIGTLPLILHTLLMTNGLSELRARETSKDEKKTTFVKRQNGILLGKNIIIMNLKSNYYCHESATFSRNKLSQNDSLAENYTSLGLFLSSVFLSEKIAIK